MAINLNKDHYRGKKNNAVYPNAYIDGDGEIYPNGKPAESSAHEIYPQEKAAEAVHEIYPDIQTVGNDVPAKPQSGDVRTLPPRNGVTAANTKKRKGFSKGAAAALVALSIAALAAFPIILIAKSDDEGAYSSYGSSSKYYEYSTRGTKMITVSAASEVYISASSDDMIGVSCSEDEEVDLDPEDGVLTIGEGEASGEDISIYVPRSFEGDIRITNSNDEVSISGVILNNIEISNSNGEIRLNDTRIKGSADIQTSSERISTYCTEFLGSCTIETSNAGISASNTAFGGDTVLSTSNGDISVYDVSFENMEMKTENGNISGQAYGSISDYKITARTKNGSNTLGSSADGKYELKCSDSNGNISLRFDGEMPEAPEFYYYDDESTEGSAEESEVSVGFYDENGEPVPSEEADSYEVSASE